METSESWLKGREAHRIALEGDLTDGSLAKERAGVEGDGANKKLGAA